MVINGTVTDVISVKESITQVVVRTKRENAYIYIAFTCHHEITALIRQLRLEKGDIVKITYYVSSKKYENRYYTSAIAEKIHITQKKSEQLMVDLETGEIY
jgi:hypothetical protein